MSERILNPVDRTLVSAHGEEIAHHAAAIARLLENVEAADDDGVKWVALDNLRSLPAAASKLMVAVGRLLAAADDADSRSRL